MTRRTHRIGMVAPLALTIIFAFAAVAGAAYFASKRREQPEPSPAVRSSATPIEAAGSSEPTPAPQQPTAQGSFRPSGQVLAGTTTPFVDFTQKDYEQALRENRVIVLYFYANWCPICRVELERTHAAFDELQLPNVVGFRVSYNDNETDDFEENLARQFGIAYQHTKVILKSGQQVLKNGETWSKERYITEITKAAQ